MHVPIHPASYRYLRLALSPTEVFYFKALPFGLNIAPLIFTQIVESIASHMRQMFSLHVHVYLDDWLLCHQHRKTLLKVTPQDHRFSTVSRMGGQFREVVSDPESQVRLFESPFPVRPRCSLPSRSTVGQVTAGAVQFIHSEVGNSKKFTKPLRSCKFPRIAGRSRKIARVQFSSG